MSIGEKLCNYTTTLAESFDAETHFVELSHIIFIN